MDRNRLIASAQKFIQRGQHDKAIAAYRELLRADPGDARLMLRMGDLEHQAGRPEKAVAAYRQAAEHYTSSGFFTKAVGVLKTMRNIAPEDLELGMELANLYEQISLYGDARKHYREVLEAARKTADYKRQLRALARLTALDEDNVPTALEYADLLRGDRRESDATEHLRQTAHVLYRAGRIDDYLLVADKLLQHAPEEMEERIRRARVLLERGETSEAAAMLEGVTLANPDSAPLLDLFVEWKSAVAGAGATEASLLEVARAALADGSETHARAIAVRIKALRRRTQDSAAVVAVSSPADEAALADLEGEAEVFVRYQLLDKALAKLDEVLRRDPHRLSACRRRRELLEEKGEAPIEVARACLLEARALATAGQEEEARHAVEAASIWAPNEPSVVRALEQAQVEPSGLALLTDDGILAGGSDSGSEASPALSLPPDLAVALQGVEQSLTEGLLDEAVATVNQLLVEYPSHAEILARVLDDLSAAIDEQSVHGALAEALEGEDELEFVDVETVEIQTLSDEQLALLRDGGKGPAPREEESDVFSLEEMMLADETANYVPSAGGEPARMGEMTQEDVSSDDAFEDDLFLAPDEDDAPPWGALDPVAEDEQGDAGDESLPQALEPDAPVLEAPDELLSGLGGPRLAQSPLASPDFAASASSYSPASWLDRLSGDAQDKGEGEVASQGASTPSGDEPSESSGGGLFGEALKLPQRAHRASELLADLMGGAAPQADDPDHGKVSDVVTEAPAMEENTADAMTLDVGEPIELETEDYSDERGRMNPSAPLPFAARDRVLQEAPGSTLAEAIQQRAAGEAMAALMTFEMEREGEYGLAASFESALAHFEVGLYLETVSTLAEVARTEGLADEDLASVRYLEALAYEALAQDHEAIQLFSMLEEVFPGRYLDIPERLRRLRLE